MKSIAMITFAAVLLASAAARAELVWTLYVNDDHAFIGVVDGSEVEEPEGHYPFAMTCSLSDGETSTVSDVDSQALGEAIAAGGVPTYSLILDGDTENAISQVPDIHFGQMEGVWEYVTPGAPYYLLQGAATIRIEGIGVGKDLPTTDLTASLASFGAACDRINAAR